MTTSTANTGGQPRQLGRSVLAIFLGFLAVFALSLGVDEVLHLLAVYPPWGQPMNEPGLNLLALSYRCVIQVAGGWIMARYAPYAPMRHAMIGSLIGLALSTFGAVATIPMHLGPAWYPILLAVSSVPTTWLGAVLYLKRRN